MFIFIIVIKLGAFLFTSFLFLLRSLGLHTIICSFIYLTVSWDGASVVLSYICSRCSLSLSSMRRLLCKRNAMRAHRAHTHTFENSNSTQKLILFARKEKCKQTNNTLPIKKHKRTIAVAKIITEKKMCSAFEAHKFVCVKPLWTTLIVLQLPFFDLIFIVSLCGMGNYTHIHLRGNCFRGEKESWSGCRCGHTPWAEHIK